jgi:hypothetical protein
MNMKRLMMLIAFMIMILPIMSCKKEVPEINQIKMVLSSELWIPGELYYDDEYCYWIDPELWDEPIAPEEIYHGVLDQKGYMEVYVEYINGHEVIKQRPKCFDTGDVCGKQYRLNPNGTYDEIGSYLKTQ